MEFYKMKLTEDKKIKGLGKAPSKQLLIYDISRNDKQEMNMKEFKDMYKGFKTKYGTENLMVKALNDTQWFTFKGFSDSGLDVQDFEDYYKNRVASKEKFNQFYQIQMTVMK
jgi:hypothetical protein